MNHVQYRAIRAAKFMRRSLALVACVLLLMAQKADSVHKPTFLKTHRVYSARDSMLLQVRIVPDKRIRTVILEAWELESEEPEEQENGILSEWSIPTNPKRIALRRSSVIDAEVDRAIYGFLWRYGLDRGDYHILAKLYLGNGVHVESTPLIVLVR
jgi:hypothetical protein